VLLHFFFDQEHHDSIISTQKTRWSQYTLHRLEPCPTSVHGPHGRHRMQLEHELTSAFLGGYKVFLVSPLLENELHKFW
jgi:hypothetical protein